VTAVVERANLATPARRPARFSVLVVVADPTHRARVVQALHRLGAWDVAEAATAAEARVRVHASGPRDLCVVGFNLPDGSGLALVSELRSAGLSHGLVLSSLEDPYTVRAALSAGVRGFLVTEGEANGSARPAPAIALRRPGAARATARGGPHGLSARELEVLELVADGKSNNDIGSALGLSGLTVKSHLARIARKLGTGDRAEMVAVALRAGAIS
jgi:DNA-binding NarL/FixJ family response regulator